MKVFKNTRAYKYAGWTAHRIHTARGKHTARLAPTRGRTNTHGTGWMQAGWLRVSWLDNDVSGRLAGWLAGWPRVRRALRNQLWALSEGETVRS